MNDQPVDFLAPLLESSVLSETLDLISEPSVDELRSIVLRARQAYLSARLSARELPKDDYGLQLAELTRIAFILEDLSVDALSANIQQQDDNPHQGLELAGLIFEYVGDFAPEAYSSLTAYNWYLHSAVCYSLGRYEANSALLAQRVAKKSGSLGFRVANVCSTPHLGV